MAMPHTAFPPQLWTAEMVRALPDDGNRYEIVDGELLVTPSPRAAHQSAVTLLVVALESYLRGRGLGAALAAPADVSTGMHVLVQPDVFVAPLVDGRRPQEWSEVLPLLLVVEVLSPSTAKADRTTKRRLYQRMNVPEYWIVDLDSRLVERWRPADERPEILTDTLTWLPAGMTPLTIDLPAFFREVLGQ